MDFNQFSYRKSEERKVRELERRLDQLKTEAETLRRKGEELRTSFI